MSNYENRSQVLKTAHEHMLIALIALEILKAGRTVERHQLEKIQM
jgi:hypothetical protein